MVKSLVPTGIGIAGQRCKVVMGLELFCGVRGGGK